MVPSMVPGNCESDCWRQPADELGRGASGKAFGAEGAAEGVAGGEDWAADCRGRMQVNIMRSRMGKMR